MLTADKVKELVSSALYDQSECPEDGSPPEGAVLANGIITQFGFKPERLLPLKPQVAQLIQELDPKFRREGGASFLMLMHDKDGNQWGEEPHAEAFYCLAAALGLATIPLPKPLWFILPCGLPYMQFIVEN